MKKDARKAGIPGQGTQFKPGPDPRRNRGNKNAEAQSFAIQFRNALAKKLPPDKIADILVKQAKGGRPWAVQEFLDRLMGRSAQPIGIGGQIDGTLIIKVIQVKDDGNNS